MSDSTEDDDSPPQEDNGLPLWTGLLFPLILARPPLSPEAAGIDPGIVNMKSKLHPFCLFVLSGRLSHRKESF